MSRNSIVGASVFAVLLAGAGCMKADENVDVVRSSLGGPTGFGGGTNTVGSPIRGYATVTPGAGGTSEPQHAVAYRQHGPGNGTPVLRRTSTPLSFLPTSLGGNALVDSAPWGYMRADNVDVVLYIDVNRHVHEIRRVGSSNVDLDFALPPINAPLAHGGQQNGPIPDAIGYIRTGLRSAVIYRDTSDHVVELLHNPGGNPAWLVSDLTVLSGSQFIVGKGSPFPYTRSDGYNTIVYTGNDAHIHELSTFGTPGSGTGAWGDGDLSFITGTIGDASTDPWGYRRSDNFNVVVYVGEDGQMHELSLGGGGGWAHGLLPAVSPLKGLHRRPSGYVRGDGINAVVYVGVDDAVHEIALVGGGWVDSVLPTPPTVIQKSQVFGHLAPGNLSAVLFRATSNGFSRGYALRKILSGGWTLQEF